MFKDPEYEWDEAKAASNVAKHGVPFTAAQEFDWRRALIIPDVRRDYGEPRWRAISYIGTRLHVLVCTVRHGRIRIISLRKANRRERNAYENTVGR